MKVQDFGSEFDAEIEKNKEPVERVKAAISLVPDMQNGRLLYHWITLPSRKAGLEEAAREREEELTDIPITTRRYESGELTNFTAHLLESMRYLDKRHFFASQDDLLYYGTCANKEVLRTGEKDTRFLDFPNAIIINGNKYTRDLPLSRPDIYFSDIKKLVTDAKHDCQDSAILGKFERGIACHLTGFGDAALKHGDVENAIRAYQMAGVMDSRHVFYDRMESDEFVKPAKQYGGKIGRYARQGKKEAMQVREAMLNLGIAKPA